jgi:DNA-binding CsgD family transcriptional regulator/tetratricopeptide (TPR) repeat protein
LEWTCSLLEQDESLLLRRLSVFVGGWTLEAAEAVCADDTLPEKHIIDALGRLVTRSLVMAERNELVVRYRLLETVRAYGFGQLEAVGEMATLRERHAAYMLKLAEREPPETLNAAHAARLRVEEDNVRAALAWAVEYEQVELGLALATATYVLWWFTGHFAEGSAWLEQLLTLRASPSAVRGRALVFAAQMRQLLSDYALAQMYAHSALEAQQALGDAQGIALALMVLGTVAAQRGDLVLAASFYADATPRLRELGAGRELVSLFQTGVLAAEFGDLAHVRDVIHDLEKLGEARPQPNVLTGALHLRSRIAASQGDVAGAISLLDEALASHRLAADELQIAVTLIKLGNLRLDQGQTRTAIEGFAEALHFARDAGDRLRLIRALEGCARVLAVIDPDAAVRLAGAIATHRETLGAARWPSEQRTLESWLPEVQRKLKTSAYQRAWEDGCASTLAQAVSLAEAVMLAWSDVVVKPSVLSKRELEVASLLARGLTNKQIAAELVVSAATVRTHVEHILIKLDLQSRAQIAVWASRNGLLPS